MATKASAPDPKSANFNTIHIRDGKFYAVETNEAGKIAAEVEFATKAEADEFVRKSMNFA